MRQGVALTAFTDRGNKLAESLAEALGGTLRKPAEPLAAWVSREFPVREALVFVGACGIAVRAVAPHLENKSSDPAVVNLDETGHYVIPLLSGHLGGANALARRLAALTGGEAVVTTATDIYKVYAVDLWAKKQGLSVRNPEKIKAVSAKLLRGEEAAVDCAYPIRGPIPPGIKLSSPGDVLVSCRPTEGDVLHLIPRVLTLGVGCKRGTDLETLQAAFARFCLERQICPEAVEKAASIDRKQDEAGLLAFCAERAWPLHFYSAKALQSLPGTFTASRFVEETTGVDNVCERAAVLSSGGKIIEKKYALNGVTFALAERYAAYDWSWQDGEAVCDRDRPRR